MDRLRAMEIFAQVAEARSFSAAAQTLGLSNTAVSKHVMMLEESLGVRLLNRTTRQVNLTEVGRAYLARAREILTDVEELEISAADLHASPRGLLRINAPVSFGSLHIAPAVSEFLDLYPDLQVDLSITDRFVDVIDDRLDVAIRGRTTPEDSSLIGRKIAPERFVLCASPAYLADRREPRHPDDLAAHSCFAYAQTDTWRFARGGTDVAIPVNGRFRSNNGEALRAAVRHGQGVALLPTFLVADDLQSGQLRSLLPDYRVTEAGLYAIYPHRRLLSAKVRLFIDFLIARFNPTPYWDQDIPQPTAI
jgi:DNA-binding transcriptional LysR family regulator